MILCVNADPCVEVTYVLDPEEHDEVESESRCLGGAGLNVARNLRKLGRETAVLGYMTQEDVGAFERLLNAYRLPFGFVEFGPGRVRTDERYIRKAKLRERKSTPGPAVTAEQEGRFLEVFREQAANCECAVFTGPLPAGASPDLYAQLARAVANGAPVLVDACGEALKKAVAAAPTLVKVNEEELGEYAGFALKNAKKRRKAAELMLGAGVKYVLVSLARDGAELYTESAAYAARQKNIVAINPVGAGDGMLAAAADALLAGLSPQELALRAVAGGSEKVLEINASDFDRRMYESFWDNIEVKGL